jgi:hypothetical protein
MPDAECAFMQSPDIRLHQCSLLQRRKSLLSEEPSIKGRINATKIIAGRRLRVTCVPEEQGYVIITVTSLEAPEEIP